MPRYRRHPVHFGNQLEEGLTCRYLTCLAIVFGWISAFAASAADEKGTFAIRGAGLIDCATYLAEREKRSAAYMMMGGWIDGYVTAVNQRAAETYDATSFESTELITEIISLHCKTHLYDRLFSVLNSIVVERWMSRVMKHTPLVDIRSGELHVQLYSETILRVQNRLKKRRLLKTAATGQFDADTIAALAAFQKTINFKPTGFPDQATLWRLLTE